MRKKLLNRRYLKIELDRDIIKSITNDLFKQVAEGPKQCCLDVAKAERKLGVRFLTVEKT